jgi:hypothetical protein
MENEQRDSQYARSHNRPPKPLIACAESPARRGIDMSLKPIRFLSALALLLFSIACGSDTTAPVEEGTPGTPGTTPPPPPPTPAPDVFMAGARAAWTYVENNTNATTGLASATESFKNATTWDIASQIGATY